MAGGGSARIRTAADIGPRIVTFNAKDPRALLPIVTQRPTQDAAIQRVGAIPSCEKAIGLIGMTPAITARDTDIWSSPIVEWCDDRCGCLAPACSPADATEVKPKTAPAASQLHNESDA